MKNLKSVLPIIFVALLLFACNAQTSENQTSETQNNAQAVSDDIQVYYFHNTMRCATCNAVEEETKMALEIFFGENIEDGSIEFTSLNLEEEEGESMAQTLKVSGQTLLIVRGETQVNLTNEAFMNARINPTKFHEILKAQIDKLL
jgi:outer membrane PBP1 activator LpoA protein